MGQADGTATLAGGTAEMASSRNGQMGQQHHTYFRYFWVEWQPYVWLYHTNLP